METGTCILIGCETPLGAEVLAGELRAKVPDLAVRAWSALDDDLPHAAVTVIGDAGALWGLALWIAAQEGERDEH